MKNCALIVTFNRLEKLKNCIIASDNANFEAIVIVNNASTDGTREWLAANSNTRFRVLNLPKNCGGAGGFSYGLKYIVENLDPEWVFLYDDDAYPKKDILPIFHKVNQEYQCDAYCGKVVELSGRVCKMNIPVIRFPAGIREQCYYVFDKSRFLVSSDKHHSVAAFSFVGAILSYKFIVRNLDGLHPELFIYFDDIYFTYNAYLKNESLLYFPDVIFVHDVSINDPLIFPEWKVYYLIRNMIFSRFIFSAHSPFGRLTIFLRIVNYIAKLHYQKNKMIYIGYLLKGLWDGFFGKHLFHK